MNVTRFLLAAAILAVPAAPTPAQDSACFNAVQGRIAWNQRGETRWAASNIERLCAGAESSTEPARCFSLYGDRRLDRGPGGPWTWQEGLKLCAGTLNHGATIDCFSQRLRAGLSRGDAIDACRWTVASGGNAAPIQLPSSTTMRKLNPVPAQPATWRKSDVAASRVRGVYRGAASPAIGRVAALSRFRLEYNDRDHKIRQISVLAQDRFAAFALGDSDGQDTFDAEGTWAVLSAGQAGTATATGGGRMDLRLDPGPPNSTLVLTGFEFRRFDGTDANVRMLGVRLDPEASVAQVWLIDDQGFDIREFESIGWAHLGGLVLPPIGNIIAGAATAPPARPGVAGNLRPYTATIQYAWIPNSMVSRSGSASGSTHSDRNPLSISGLVALQGFEFVFTNSDHHLHGIAVTLNNRVHNVYQHVMFRDQGYDDPMQWAVSYVELDPRYQR